MIQSEDNCDQRGNGKENYPYVNDELSCGKSCGKREENTSSGSNALAFKALTVALQNWKLPHLMDVFSSLENRIKDLECSFKTKTNLITATNNTLNDESDSKLTFNVNKQAILNSLASLDGFSKYSPETVRIKHYYLPTKCFNVFLFFFFSFFLFLNIDAVTRWIILFL
jgi:hypothetical protein